MQLKNFRDWLLGITTGWSFIGDGTDEVQLVTSELTPLINRGNTMLTEYAGRFADMYDPETGRFTPKRSGLASSVRVDFEVRSTTQGSELSLELVLDIGTDTNLIPIVTRYINVGSNPTAWRKVSIGFPIYMLDTFVANGGRFMVRSTSSVNLEIQHVGNLMNIH